MNEVSIIINGVRYDAVETKTEYSCEECDLRHLCEKAQHMCLCLILDIEENRCFKKSDKEFEKVKKILRVCCSIYTNVCWRRNGYTK